MLTLSATDLDRLQASLETLLSPLAFDSVDAWRLASIRSVQLLLQADKSGFLFPLPGHELLVGEQIDMEGFRAYTEYFWQLDVGFQQRRKELQLEVNNLSMVYEPESLKETEVYNDFSRRYGFLDALAMSTDLDPSSAGATVVVYHDSESRHEFGGRGVALLRMLLPALKAGATACARHHAQRASTLQFVDDLRDGCLVMDSSGAVIHQTSAFDSLLGSDPERARVRMECIQLADSLVRPVPRSRTPLVGSTVRRSVRTSRAHYTISGSILGSQVRDPTRLALVSLTASAPSRLTDADLRERFRLTPRELQVAHLIANGQTDAKISEALGVSIHTARRHTEHVLTKLGVHSRSAVGPRMAGSLPE